ncbi:MAG: N-acetylglucosamine kinase, partial [Sphingobacteriaceae bacterium]|nr:N-acetylglucosamine kinase [Sphingobacteriaceae bacterium]
MILVADSGSTKTDWMGFADNQTLKFNTEGLNPYFLNSDEVAAVLSTHEDLLAYADKVKEVYFFGSGCSSPDKHEIISNGLSMFFKNAFISVEHDLIGSAYASCGKEKGYTCILGTGSNISYYDGKNVVQGNFGLGYVLGDEGSGTWFGRKILTQYLYGFMPEELAKDFAHQFHVDKDEVVENIYEKPYPNRYLATFSRFMIQHKTHPFIVKLLQKGFQEFVDTNIIGQENIQNSTFNFVGSISYYYQDELKKVCAQYNI